MIKKSNTKKNKQSKEKVDNCIYKYKFKSQVLFDKIILFMYDKMRIYIIKKGLKVKFYLIRWFFLCMIKYEFTL